MDLRNFPNCCTANILIDFGDTYTSGMNTAKADFNKLDNDLSNKIRMAGDNMLVAITNNQQKTINKLLLKYGFKHSKWCKKRAHNETKLRIWWREPNPRRF